METEVKKEYRSEPELEWLHGTGKESIGIEKPLLQTSIPVAITSSSRNFLLP